MFGTILTTAFTVMHLYVFGRAGSVPFIRRHVPGKVLLSAAIALWLVFFMGRVIGHGGEGVVATVAEFSGMAWMAAVFLISVSLLAVDLATGFGFLFRRWVRELRGLGLAVGVLLSVIALFQGLRAPVVTEYEVRTAGLPSAMEGTVLVALSDTHLGSQIGNRWLADRIDQVQDLNPDLVVLLGDIFEGHGGAPERMVSTLRRLHAPLGVWGVSGNHEFHGGRGLQLLADAGVELLRDRWVEIRPGFVLAGVDDLTSRHRRGQGVNPFSRALAGLPPGATILLSHTPWHAEEAAAAGVEIMLSGHTHGGQIWPFNYLVRRVYPMLAGRYDVQGMTGIVCRGTGTWGPRMRLWHPGEILRVTLRGG
jgi:predicted MPP superfamily phosphohydrolase